ncbi:VWA domain-containing protein [soil metagenome]
MTFGSPALLWNLMLIPVAAGAYLILQRRRVSVAGRFASSHMMPNVAPHPPGWRRHLPVALTLVALLLLLLGVARPEVALSVPRDRATVVLAIDASNSMTATDVEPSRLGAARRAAVGFLDGLPERFQVGVVSFAREALTLSRATSDRVAVRRALRSIDTARGTAIGEGVMEALALRPTGATGADVPLVVVLLSDGNNTAGIDPLTAAEAAREAGVRVHTIVFGTTHGRAPGGGRSRPSDVDALRSVAQRSGGSFFSAPSEADLEAVYRDLGSSISAVRERREVTVAFIAGGLVLLLLSGGLSMLWFNRPLP